MLWQQKDAVQCGDSVPVTSVGLYLWRTQTGSSLCDWLRLVMLTLCAVFLPGGPAHCLPVCPLYSRVAPVAGLHVLWGGIAVVLHCPPHLLHNAPVQASGKDDLHQLDADGELTGLHINSSLLTSLACLAGFILTSCTVSGVLSLLCRDHPHFPGLHCCCCELWRSFSTGGCIGM